MTSTAITRRAVLGASGVLLTGAAAGCVTTDSRPGQAPTTPTGTAGSTATDEARPSPTQAPPTDTDGSAGEADAIALLRGPPFPPANPDLLDPTYYPAGSEWTVPLVPTVEQVRDELRALFETRFDGDAARVESALDLFDDPVLRGKALEPNLRAAVVALQGTFAEDVLPAFVDGPVQLVRSRNVSELLDNPRAIATARIFPRGEIHVEIDTRHAGGDFRALAPTMAHEILHHDTLAEPIEELLANAIEPLVYAQFLLESPDLARQNTELVRRANTELVARLNGRDAEGALRLLTSQGSILPESTREDLQPYADGTIYCSPGDSDAYCETDDWAQAPTTPGSPELAALVSAITDTPAESRDFDYETVLALDGPQSLFSDDELVRLARILELGLTTDPNE